MARLIARAGGTDGTALGALRPRIPSIFESAADGNPDRDDFDDDAALSDEPPAAPSGQPFSPYGLEAPPTRAEARHDFPHDIEPSPAPPRPATGATNEPGSPTRTAARDHGARDAAAPSPAREQRRPDASAAPSRRTKAGRSVTASTPPATTGRGGGRTSAEALAPHGSLDADLGGAAAFAPAGGAPRQHQPVAPSRRTAPSPHVAASSGAAPSEAAPQPIHVTIGRIEVRGVIAGASQQQPRPASTEPAVTTLDAYLRRRARGAS